MQFHNIIGQHAIKDQLMGLHQNNRLSHALLFLGKEGTGALSLARAFAQYILCDRIQGKSFGPSGGGLFGPRALGRHVRSCSVNPHQPLATS